MKTPRRLTKAERDWLDRAEALFAECPPGFDFVTIGDADLEVIDREGAKTSELADGAAEEDGIVLAHISTGGQVHGVTG